MIVYRLTKEKFKHDINGIGAEINGGRWNSKGIRMLYTSESRSLCTTEIAVHTPLGIVPQDYYLQSINLPIVKSFEILLKELDTGWKSFPHQLSTKLFGDTFIKNGKLLLMKVPSAVVQDEYNFLINPLHQLFGKVKLVKAEKFTFDTRLFIK